MTTETTHYCNEHQCTYKKYEKGDKTWYAHKNGDEWCNEAKKKERKDEPVFSVAPEERKYPQPFKADPEKQASIELQHYTSEVKDLWIAGKLTDKSPLVEKYLFILSNKIGIDSKTVTPEPLQSKTEPSKPVAVVNTPTAVKDTPGTLTVPKATPLQTTAIDLLMKNDKTKAEIKQLIKINGWKATKLSELTEPQAAIILKQFSTPETF